MWFKIFLVLFIMVFFINLAFAQNCTNESCPVTFVENNNTNYTYEENLNDPNCWSRVNFCNLQNASLSQDVINLLKQVNYQLQTDLTNCSTEINNIQIISKRNQSYVWLLTATTIIAGFWAVWITMLYRRRK